VPASINETDQIVPIRESLSRWEAVASRREAVASRREAVALSLVTVLLLNCVAGMGWGLLVGRWRSQDVIGHIVLGVYLAIITLCVGWRAARAWRRRRSGGSRSSRPTSLSAGV
jgi:hypothetical protein